MDYIPASQRSSPPPEGYQLSGPESWEYFAEGASNILFRYIGDHPYFRPFLLRLRKALPGSPTTLQLHNHLSTRFAPLLGSYLPRTELIALSPDIIPALNEPLRASDAARDDWAGRPIGVKGRSRLLDQDENYGLLVEDMSCGNYLYPDSPDFEDEERWRDMATIEFKPKWLTQSPNAPREWKLCRTCAVRTMNDSGRNRTGNNNGLPEYCPLDLSSGNRERIEQAVFAIVNSAGEVMIADPNPDTDAESGHEDEAGPYGDTLSHELAKSLESSMVTLLTLYFRQSNVITLLAELQDRFGARGVFTSATLALMAETDCLPSEEQLANQAMETNGEAGDIWTAMTLRDCSLFLKVWVRRERGKRMEAKIQCRVGDLDLKTGEGGRAVYWRDMERRLRKGGWYTKDIGRNCRPVGARTC